MKKRWILAATATVFVSISIQYLFHEYELITEFAADLAFTELDQNDPKYTEGSVRAALRFYGVDELQGETGIRFLWMRSFDPLIYIEFAQDSDGKVIFSAKKYGRLFNLRYWRLLKRRVYEDVDYRFLIEEKLYGVNFFSLAASIDRYGLDGATWLFEGKIDQDHHFISRWSPDKGTPEYRLGEQLILKAIDSPLVPIY